MAKKANGFMIFNDTMRAISPLPPEEFKSLVVAMFQYFLGEEPTPLIGVATYFWPIVTEQIDRAKASYKRRCKANAANAKKRKMMAEAAAEAATGTASGAATDTATTQKDVVFSDTTNEHLNECDTNCIQNSANASQSDRTHDQSSQTDTNICESAVNVNGNENGIEIQNGIQNEIQNEIEIEDRIQDRDQDRDQDRNVTENADADGSASAAGGTGSDAVTVTVTDTDTVTVSAEKNNENTENGDTAENRPQAYRPTFDEVRRYCAEYAMLVDPGKFFRTQEERGWRTPNGSPLTSWQRLIDSWQSTAELSHTVERKRLKAQAEAKAEAEVTAADASERKASYDIDEFYRAAIERAYDMNE